MSAFGLLLLLAVQWSPAVGIRLTRLEVPEYADPRAPVLLLCAWDLDGETLQSVKWYRDEEPFYEYRQDRASYISHPVKGIYGQRCQCDATQCTTELAVRPRPAAAAYACEVSGEGPRFRTARANRTMAVLALASSGPRITGLPPTVTADTDILLNCSTQPSLPAAQLTWLVNDRPEPSEQYTLRQADDLNSTWSTISVRISPSEAKQHYHLEPNKDIGTAQQVECRAEQLAYGRQLSQVKTSVLVAENPSLAGQLHRPSSRGVTTTAASSFLFSAVLLALSR